MRTTRQNKSNNVDFKTATPVKMKIVEILEARTTPLSVRDVVAVTGISKSKVYQKIARGELPSIRIDGSLRIDPNHLIAWWKQHQAGLASLVPASFERVSQKTPRSAAQPLEEAV